MDHVFGIDAGMQLWGQPPLDVLANDSDSDAADMITVISSSDGTHGSVACSDTDCTYMPHPNWHGVDLFSYTISDMYGAPASATVTVTVNSVNDPPDAVDDSRNIPPGDPVWIDVLANDTDVDGDSLTVTSASGASYGTVVVTASNEIKYTPNRSNVTDHFTYSISDGNSGTDTATVTVTIGAYTLTITPAKADSCQRIEDRDCWG